MTRRYLFFGFALAIGIALGLYYGWVVSPVKFISTSPNTLRVDYRSDYVLMVAEAYSVEQDAALAARRLAALGRENPLESVQEALVFAVQNNYTPEDLLLLRALNEALQTWDPSLERPAP